MASDIFGDLTEWGRVIEQLEHLRAEHLLDEHQAGLARIVRYRGNGRLVEHVLRWSTDIEQANDLLTAEVGNVLADPDADWTFRVLAARAMGHLLSHRPRQTSPSGFDAERAVSMMESLVGRTTVPVLQAALTDALESVRAASSKRRG